MGQAVTWPIHFDVSEDAEIAKNVALDSVATALPSMVLPARHGHKSSYGMSPMGLEVGRLGGCELHKLQSCWLGGWLEG